MANKYIGTDKIDVEDLDDHEILQEVLEWVGAELDNDFVDGITAQYERRGYLSKGQKEGLWKFYDKLVKD